jgi:hypothetical protein
MLFSTTTLHLTHTGAAAGALMCGMTRADALAAGHRMGHVPYSNLSQFFKRPELCPACKKVWNAAGRPARNTAPKEMK